jgi:hypothetical protein
MTKPFPRSPTVPNRSQGNRFLPVPPFPPL